MPQILAMGLEPLLMRIFRGTGCSYCASTLRTPLGNLLLHALDSMSLAGRIVSFLPEFLDQVLVVIKVLFEYPRALMLRALRPFDQIGLCVVPVVPYFRDGLWHPLEVFGSDRRSW